MTAASMGHNSVSAAELLAFIERAEQVKTEIAEKNEDLKEIFLEAKGSGFNVPIIRQLIKLRGMDTDKRSEDTATLELYMEAIGMGRR